MTETKFWVNPESGLDMGPSYIRIIRIRAVKSRGDDFDPFTYKWVDFDYVLSLTGQMGISNNYA